MSEDLRRSTLGHVFLDRIFRLVSGFAIFSYNFLICRLFNRGLPGSQLLGFGLFLRGFDFGDFHR